MGIYTVVWEKLTVGYFHVKIVRGKIFSSLGVSDKFFNNELFLSRQFKVKLYVPLLTNLMYNDT